MILTPEKWVQNGYTIAHSPEDGRPVFIHGALPGKPVSVTIVKSVSTHSFAVSDDIPPSDCTAFPGCGGCSFRHIPYDEETAIKKNLLKELKFAGKHTENFPFVSAGPDHYRNHIQIQWDSQSGRYGFFTPNTNHITGFPESGCRHLSPELNRFIQNWFGSGASASYLKKTSGNRIGILRIPFREEGGRIISPEEIRNRRIIEFQLQKPENSFRWKYASDGFFQSNRFLISDWLETFRTWISEIREETGELHAAELFCGSGLIGGYLLPYLSRWTGWDSESSSVRIAAGNFRDTGLPESSWEVRIQDLYKKIPDITGNNLIIVNPPRAGLSEKLIRLISGSGADFLLYSSCNAHTLDRDGRQLEREGFEPVKSTVFDFFPRTPHTETAMLFRKKIQ